MPRRSDRAHRSITEKVRETAPARSSYFSKPTPIDRVFQYTILLLIPSSVTPNLITFLRYLSIPFIVMLLLTGEMTPALVLFSLTAFSDAVDGALARTRDEITEWGILHDPLADKLLIGSVALIVISSYLNIWIAVTIVGIEIVLIAFAYIRYKGRVVPAKTVGKIKMVCQSVGTITLLTGVVLGAPMLLIAAEYILYAAIGFAVLSLVIYRSI
jgi:CDP-diacylglycerol--glycerol-3-phosphate 3-phosphatidyltransferase